MKFVVFGLFFVVANLSLSACAHALPNLELISPEQLPALNMDDADQGSWEAGSRSGLREALNKQLKRCLEENQQETWDFAGKKIPRSRWCVETVGWFLAKLEKAESLQEIYDAATNELEWYESSGKPDTHEVIFTGYFYPSLRVRLDRDSKYKYPIYRKPDDIVSVMQNGQAVWRRKVGDEYVMPYTRSEIIGGALDGQGLEIAYADNPVDPYFLEVQGSGELIIVDQKEREIMHQIVNFAAQNGQPYVSLGRLMLDAGIPVEYINLQGMQRYFKDEHPELWLQFSNQNPSFVFFKQEKDGPYGSDGVILTPKHSIAIDKREFPTGAVALIQTLRPTQISGQVTTEWSPFEQFVLAQDTGGAIQTPGRVDVYWGSGPYAEIAAGQTNFPGRLFFVLVPEKGKKPARPSDVRQTDRPRH